MVTLGVALVLRELANRYGWLTGGADGLQGVTIQPLFGTFRFDMFGHTGYTYCLTVLFILFLIARRLVNSPFGLSLLSVKGNPLRASAIGISVDARLVAIYTVAAGYAGIAGALLAQTTAFASLEVFSFDRSADLLLVLIIGGAGYLYGGLIGAIIFKFMQDYLSALTPQYWPFWIGLVLVESIDRPRPHLILDGADPSHSGADEWRTLGSRQVAAPTEDSEMTLVLETIDLTSDSLASSRPITSRFGSPGRPPRPYGPNGAGKTTLINLLTACSGQRAAASCSTGKTSATSRHTNECGSGSSARSRSISCSVT
jgi:hypothetical protein